MKVLSISLLSVLSMRLFAADLEIIIAKLASRVDQVEYIQGQFQKDFTKLNEEISKLSIMLHQPQGYISGVGISDGKSISRIMFAQGIQEDYGKKYVDLLKAFGVAKIESAKLIRYMNSIGGGYRIEVIGHYTKDELQNVINQVNATRISSE